METSLRFLNKLVLVVIILFSFPLINYGQTPDLGSVGNFVLFTTVGAVSNTGNSQIRGNVGSDVGAITGFDPLTCAIYNADAITEQCSADLLVAYDQLAAIPSDSSIVSLLGNGQVLTAGVYYISEAATLNSGLSLDAQGDPNAVFIFRIQGAFSTTAHSIIYLLNGALASNVFWQVEGAVAMATQTTMRGIIVANNGAISMATGSTFEGRGLSTTGGISVDGIILPVTLIDFKATMASQGVKLLWTVANEFSLAGYDLQRSADGQNFNNIGSVPATSTSFVKTYNWLDKAPLATVNFYRLKIIDIDGAFKYSHVIQIYMDAKENISVYPNPVTGNMILVKMNDQSKGNHVINLYSRNGQQVMNSTIIQGSPETVSRVALNKNLSPGVYYLEISDSGKNKKVFKLLINQP